MKDPRYEERSPQDADDQESPAPVRPVPEEEERRDGRPSQAEGEREGERGGG